MSAADSPRVVAITGAARGLGLGFARRFAAAGDSVVITDIDVEAGQAAAADLAEEGAAATFVELDVREQTAIDGVVGDIERRLGPIGV